MGLFRWWTRRFFLSDTQKTLDSVRKLSKETQLEIGQAVAQYLDEQEHRIARLSRREQQKAIAEEVQVAKALRHHAIREGARSRDDPTWAAAAIIEGWMLAKSGNLGDRAFKEIDDLLGEWLTELGRE